MRILRACHHAGLCLIALTWTAAVVAGGQGKVPRPTPLVTINRENANVRDILADIFRQAHQRYRFVDVQPFKMTIKLTKVPFSTALRSVLRSTQTQSRPLTYEMKGPVYVIHPVGAHVKPK